MFDYLIISNTISANFKTSVIIKITNKLVYYEESDSGKNM